MNYIKPYSDDKMFYNEQTKQYELKMSYIKDTMPNTLADDGVLSHRIRLNTMVVYNAILMRSHSLNKDLIYDLINHTEEYRKWVLDALSMQMQADLLTAYNDIQNMVAKNQAERNMQFINQISPLTESILYNSSSYGGINLMCQYPINFNWRY